MQTPTQPLFKMSRNACPGEPLRDNRVENYPSQSVDLDWSAEIEKTF